MESILIDTDKEIKVQLPDIVLDRIIYLSENIRDCQFAIGDILLVMFDESGISKKSPIINYIAGKTGISASLLYDYESTSRRWSPEYRAQYPYLDWSIYRNSDPVLDKKLLEEAIDNNYSATTFKEKKYPQILEPSRLVRMSIAYLNKMRNLNEEQSGILKEIKERLDLFLKTFMV